MVSILDRVKTKLIIVSLAMTTYFATTIQVSAASKISAQVNKASNGFVELLQSIGKPAVMCVIAVLGLGLVIATQHQKENIKDGVLGKIIGVAVLVLAVPAADAIWGIF